MMHSKKVKGKWQYFEGQTQITEYEYILKTEARQELQEIAASVEALADAQELPSGSANGTYIAKAIKTDSGVTYLWVKEA